MLRGRRSLQWGVPLSRIAAVNRPRVNHNRIKMFARCEIAPPEAPALPDIQLVESMSRIREST